MAIPPYQTFGLAQGLDAGLRARQLALSQAYEQAQLGQSEQQIQEERRRNIAQEALSGAGLEEQIRAALVGERQRGTELGIAGFTAGSEAQTRQQQLVQAAQAERALEQYRTAGLTEEQRHALVGESLSQQAENRAQQQVQFEEQIRGRQLTDTERQQIFEQEYQRAQLAEQVRQSLVGEQLSGGELGLQQAQLGESTRHALVGESQAQQQIASAIRQAQQQYGLQQQSLAGSLGQAAFERGLQTEQQAERERAARVGEALSGGTLGVEQQRAQTEAGQAAWQQRYQGAQLDLERFNSLLENGVKNRQIDVQDAANLRDYAARQADQGIKVSEWMDQSGLRQAQQQLDLANAAAAGSSDRPIDDTRFAQDLLLKSMGDYGQAGLLAARMGGQQSLEGLRQQGLNQRQQNQQQFLSGQNYLTAENRRTLAQMGLNEKSSQDLARQYDDDLKSAQSDIANWSDKLSGGPIPGHEADFNQAMQRKRNLETMGLTGYANMRQSQQDTNLFQQGLGDFQQADTGATQDMSGVLGAGPLDPTGLAASTGLDLVNRLYQGVGTTPFGTPVSGNVDWSGLGDAAAQPRAQGQIQPSPWRFPWQRTETQSGSGAVS